MTSKTAQTVGISLAVMSAFVAWAGYALLLHPKGVVPNSVGVQGPLVIGLSLADHRQSRWQVESDIMSAEAARLGATLLVEVADGDSALQEAQAKKMMASGAKVLIVVANDAEKASNIVNEAHKLDVKVIAYDRLIRKADLDYYLSFDNIKVGEVQARGILDAIGSKGNLAYIGGSPTDNNADLVRTGSFNVLQPKIDSGDVKVVLDKQVLDWNADTAHKIMADFLNKGGKVDGVVAANDGMAGGVIKALREKGLAGTVPVSGQDAELRACRDLLTGDQTLTVYKPLPKLAVAAVQMAIAVAKHEQLITNANVDNGKMSVPSQLLNVVMVTKKNIDSTIILDGFHTRGEIYGN